MSDAACSVSAIVVTYTSQAVLGQCLTSVLNSLAASTEATELIVVDNGSGGTGAAFVRERFPELEVIEVSENQGFARGLNAGLRRARGEFRLLVNDDAVLDRGAVPAMLKVMRSADDIGSVAAQMRFAAEAAVAHDVPRINSAGLAVDRLGVAHDRLLGQAITKSEDEPTEVFGVSGGAALYRQAMLADVGGFDESFVVYLEDLDVAWRARLKGWRAFYAPDAIVDHHHSLTTRHGSPYKYFNVGRNRIRVLAKNADTRLLLRYGTWMVAYDVAYCAFVGLRGRTLTPVTGRVAGLREWRAYRSKVGYRRPVALLPPQGLRAALGRYDTWTTHSLGLHGRGGRPTGGEGS